MEETDGIPRRREPFLASEEGEVAKASWRLNLNEFRLPSQTDNHQHKRPFTFRSILRKPSETFLSSFFFSVLL